MKDFGEVDALMADCQSRFDALEAERKKLAEERAVLDRRLTEIVTAQVELRGEYSAYTKLKTPETPSTAPPATEASV